MPQTGLLWLSILLAPLVPGVLGQNGNCGTANTNGNCQIVAGYPVPDSTVYYAPDDNDNIQFYAQAGTNCDSAALADVTFNTGSYPGSLVVDCGCLPLDGNPHTLDCGIPRIDQPDGTYNFQVYLGPELAYDIFTITHSQVTSTAATPTITATATYVL